MIPRHKQIAFDLDDVLLDFVGGLRAAIRKEYGVTITDDQITGFDLHPLLDPIIGHSWWEWLRRRDWLWSNFPVMDGAIGYLERLRREGYYLEVVTSKPEWADYAVWKWLGKWRPPVQKVTIVRKDDNKAHFSNAIVLVDDKFENCLDWVQSDPKRIALLFDRPHNRENPVGGIVPIIRVYDWQDTYEQIERITNE
jgi:uncharacterized HAD superfamily protein